MLSALQASSPIMSSAIRSASSVWRQSISRSTAASTSRQAIRAYATEAEQQQAEYTYGTTISKRLEGADIRTYTGKGVPHLNSTRNRVSIHHAHLWNQGPFKPLTIPLRRKGGRNVTGRITTRGIGGGHKRRLRTLDFFRFHPGVHDVVRIEFDPGRSGHIALIRRRYDTVGMTADERAKRVQEVEEEDRNFAMPLEARLPVKSGWSYILAPDGLRAGDTVQSFRRGIPDGFVEGWKNELEEGEELSPRALGLLRTVVLKPGNVLPLYLIPPGQTIHNISFTAQGSMKISRSAGTSAQIVAHQKENGEALGGLDILKMGQQWTKDGTLTKKDGWVLVKMTSGEVRKLSPGCVATIGNVSNKEFQLVKLGKAGRARNLGKRPIVRGVVMNAVDHPHGGGKGKGKGGKQAHSYKGKLTRGVRTRRPFPLNKRGNRMVVTQRPRGPHSGNRKK